MDRLDQALVERGLCVSREKAKRSILAGQVLINSHVAKKASDKVRETDELTLKQPEKYVSRGGHKLEHALQHLKIDPSGLNCLDLGSSTGGFTDCLLQAGARKVTSVDVGKGQLAWKLRNNERVVVMEKTNARNLTPESFASPFEPVDLVVIDCSFISLRKILPVTIALLRPSGRIATLIKPQFEAGKAEVDKGNGVIKDPAIHDRVIQELRDFTVNETPLIWKGVTASPLLGPAGNKEFLALIEKAG